MRIDLCTVTFRKGRGRYGRGLWIFDTDQKGQFALAEWADWNICFRDTSC